MRQNLTGERLAKLEQKTEDMRNDINHNHTDVISAISNINTKLDEHFVSKEEFKPVKALTYGAATIILSAVLTAIVYLVIIRPS